METTNKIIVKRKERLLSPYDDGFINCKLTIKLTNENNPNDLERFFITWQNGALSNNMTKLNPELDLFNKLHLSSYKGFGYGYPSNFFYNLGITGPKGRITKEDFMYSNFITSDEYDHMIKLDDVLEVSKYMSKIELFKRWEYQANKAIKSLEKMSGKKFKSKTEK